MRKKGLERVLILVVAGLVILMAGCKTTSRQAKSKQHAESPVAASSPAGKPSATGNEFLLVGTKWLLVELRGQKEVKSPDSKEVSFLQLTEDGRANAYAGCNRMFGGYELKEGLQIRFTAIASTRMACPDMNTEQILGEVLATADNYSISGRSMTLNKGRMAPLARFEAEK